MKIIALFSALLLSGCASIIDGTKQEVEIQTAGVGCAQCKLSNSKDTYNTTCTPQKITVKRAYGPLSVACYGPGVQGEAEVDSHVKGWFFGNILLGGLIGMGVDAATGGAWDYPDSINVQMERFAGNPPQHPAHQTTAAQPAPVNPAAAAHGATTQRYHYNPQTGTGYQPLYTPRHPRPQ